MNIKKLLATYLGFTPEIVVEEKIVEKVKTVKHTVTIEGLDLRRTREVNERLKNGEAVVIRKGRVYTFEGYSVKVKHGKQMRKSYEAKAHEYRVSAISAALGAGPIVDVSEVR